MPAWLVLAAALAAAALALLPMPWFARRLAGYVSRRDTISELGAAGARDARAVAWLWFLPTGLALLGFCAALAAVLPARADTAVALLSLMGVSYVGAAIFPCDPGAPLSGTTRNAIHNLLGGLGYGGAGAGLIEIVRTLEDMAGMGWVAAIARLLGPAVLLGLFAMTFPGPLRGAIQRAVEGALFAWMLLLGGALAWTA